MIDVNAFIGGYPFREVARCDPADLVSMLDRERLHAAWVGHLPSAFHRDPQPGSDALFAAIAPFAGRLYAVPTVRPDWPLWERALGTVRDAGAVAIRVYPPQWQMAADDPNLCALALASGAMRLPIILTVRFEDVRQRHPLDVAGDLSAATVRALARAGPDVRLIVTAAGKDFIAEVHWGLTPEEQRRVFWDISWIWGPPEEHLRTLFATMGPERFLFGTQWPLRLSQTPRANLDLLPDEQRARPLADPEHVYDDAPA